MPPRAPCIFTSVPSDRILILQAPIPREELERLVMTHFQDMVKYEHINVHGKVRFRLEDRPRLGELLALRVPPEPASDLPPLP